MKLVELNEGKKKVLVEGNLDDIVKWLKDNEDEYDWIKDEDPSAEMPDLEKIETERELMAELSKVDLNWWTLEIEE